MVSKKAYISARISPELRFRLDLINAKNKTDDSDLVRDAMTAVADYVEKQGCYRSPIRVVFDEAGEMELRAIVEEQAQANYDYEKPALSNAQKVVDNLEDATTNHPPSGFGKHATSTPTPGASRRR